MTLIQCGAVLFDMDGVLVDSTPAVERVWTGWALEHGLLPDEVVRRAHGRPSLATIIELLPQGDHEAENRELERREIEDVADVIALPGALQLLQSIPPKRWAIVTSASRRLAKVRLLAAGLPVPEHLVTSNDIQHGKPFPDPYLKGAEILGVAPTDCVVVGRCRVGRPRRQSGRSESTRAAHHFHGRRASERRRGLACGRSERAFHCDAGTILQPRVSIAREEVARACVKKRYNPAIRRVA